MKGQQLPAPRPDLSPMNHVSKVVFLYFQCCASAMYSDMENVQLTLCDR